tara:strand:+ start:138 stop:359 length:222 start_codon:yes stop_codon:yes gene_type:complete
MYIMPDYWRTALIRAGRTFAQSFIAVLMANQAGMFEADVVMAAGIAGASAAVSVVQNALEDAPFPFMSKIPKG